MVTKNLKLKVNGMHCNGCANKIKAGVESLNANAQTDVNVMMGNVQVSFDGEKASLQEVKEKIIAAGFQIESVEID